MQAKGRPRVITRSKSKPKKANSAESPLVLDDDVTPLTGSGMRDEDPNTSGP